MYAIILLAKVKKYLQFAEMYQARETREGIVFKIQTERNRNQNVNTHTMYIVHVYIVEKVSSPN